MYSNNIVFIIYVHFMIDSSVISVILTRAVAWPNVLDNNFVVLAVIRLMERNNLL